MAIGRRVVEQAIGEKLTGEPLDDPSAGKNPAAVALESSEALRAALRGRPRFRRRKRKAIAKKAAKARWG